MRSNVDKSAGFIAGDDGGMTVFGMFLTVAFLMMGGYAIDLAHVMAARTQAQITADATAHAALVTRERNPEARAKEVALSIARGNMPPETFGDFIDADAIEFGYWDANTAAFVPQPGARSAVRVSVSRHEDRDNPVPTFLVHLAGLDQWNVTRKAVLVTYQPTCFTEGFVAEGIVDIQSNNSYYNGFCLHSNSHVELNSNNYFEPGTIVSMPNPDDIVLPNSGYERNEGLLEALRSGSYNIRILARIDDIIAGLESGAPEYLPDFIPGTAPSVTLSTRRLTAGNFTENRVHTYTCSSNQRLTIEAGTTLRNIALVTNCEIVFGSGVVLEDVVMATTNPGQSSIKSASGLRLGRDDNCAPGGGVQLVTRGGMNFPADLHMFGSQLLARLNIEFAANANGIQGASMVAGGRIDGTSNMNMSYCGSGMEDNYTADYFRLVY